jgi:hypothetical protein
MSKLANENTGAFETDLKTNPRLVYQKYRAEVISWASNRCNEITGPSGLLAWVLTPAEWAAFPPNRTVVAGVLVIAPIFDILTPIEIPPNNATNAVMKIYEISKNDRAAIVQTLQTMKMKQIHTMPVCDISEMSDVVFGMTSVNNAQIFAHLHGAYSELDQNDYSIIYSRLQSVKLPTEDYKTLAETHRDLHVLLATSGQPSTELAKTNYFMEALKTDYAGHEACREFIRAHPQVATRTFVDLVATVLLHAPTAVPTTSAFGYSNAQTTTSIASAAPLVPTTEAALVAHIAESQRKLSAMRRTGGSAPAQAPVPKPANPAIGGQPIKYCYKHGYQRSHAGADCFVLKRDTHLYDAQHLAATDHNNPPGGNPIRKG